MKKRIIATILLLVMVLATFASCGAYKFSDEKDFGEYAYVSEENYQKLITLLTINGVYVEDEEFSITADRDKIVRDDIYDALANALVKDEDNKKTEGTIGATDVVNYYYYGEVTITKEGETEPKTFKFGYANMNKTASIKLPTVNAEDKVLSGVKNALLPDGGLTLEGNNGYKIETTSSHKIENGNTIVVSYKMSYKEYDEQGNETLAPDEVTTVTYLTITLDTENDAFHKYLVDTAKPTVGNKKTIEYTTYPEDDEATADVKEGKKVVTTYTDFTVLYEIEEITNGQTFTVTYDEEKEFTGAFGEDGITETIKVPANTTITYHVYPASYVQVSANFADDVKCPIGAADILKHVIGKNLKASTLDVFTSEEYKNGEDTVKALIEKLVEEYAKSATKDYAEVQEVKDAQTAYDTAKETTKTAKEAEEAAKAAYDAAQKIVTDAGEAATDEQKADRDAKKTAYDTAKTTHTNAKTAEETAKNDLAEAQTNAQEKAVDELIGKIVAATKTVDSAEVTVCAELKEQYAKAVYSANQSEYDEKMTEKIGKAVWTVLKDYVTINREHKSYKKVIDKYVDAIYEQYEYSYYKENTGSSSNYSQFDSVEDLIVSKLKLKNTSEVDAALAKEAGRILDDQLVVYAIAQALDSHNADKDHTSWIESSKNVLKEMYENSYGHDHDENSDHDHDDEIEETYQSVLNSAKDLLVTNKVFNAYKDELGRSQYNLYVDSYGEENLRMNLQFSKLMSFLLYTDYEKYEDSYKVAYVDTDDEDDKVDSFAYKFIKYTTEKPETPAE